MFAFGDSLSDVGNATIAAYLATEQDRSPLLFGRPNSLRPFQQWSHLGRGPLSNYLHLGTLTPSLIGGRDYAVAGAQTGPTAIEPVSNLPADLLGQVALYASTHRSFVPRPGTLYTLDIGGNDIMSALNKYGANVPVTNVVAAAETNTVDAIESLYGLGARNLLFYEVPDLGLTPRFYKQPLQGYASFYAKWFDNTLLATPVSVLWSSTAASRCSTSIPTTCSTRPTDNSAAFGFTDVTDPCWTGNFTSSASGTVCSSPNSYLFWDLVHPTAKADAETANCAYETLTGSLSGYCSLRVPVTVAFALDPSTTVPEPSTWALMLVGLAGLGLLARRHRGIAKRDPEF